MEQTAAQLRGSGFEILRVGRNGVIVSGDDEQFTRILGVRPGASPVQEVKSGSSELADLVDLVEFVPDPKLF